MPKLTHAALPLLALALAVAECGCASRAGGAMSAILEKTGLSKPELPDTPRLPFLIPLRVHAGENLNAGAGSTPLALLVRIYQLKDATAFNAAPYEAFVDPAREKQTLGSDLIEVRELLLVPGQRYEVREKLPKEAGFLGVVALFRAPTPQRWKLAFDAGEAQLSGIAIGALACALTVTAGRPLEGSAGVLPPAHCE